MKSTNVISGRFQPRKAYFTMRGVKSAIRRECSDWKRELVFQRLVLQRHHGLIAAAEGRYFQQSIGLRQRDDWTIAIYGVAIGGEIPLAALVPGRLFAGRWGELGWGRELGKLE